MSTTFYSSQRIRLDLSQPEHTEAGRLLYAMYYTRCELIDAMPRDLVSGFPHNGGQHTLRVNMTLPDLRAFRQLVAEEFAGARGVDEFLSDFDAKYLSKMGHPLVH